MKNADVTITEMETSLRVTFNSTNAKTLANNEPEIASYLTRKDNMLYLDINKGVKNKNAMVAYLVSHNLKSISE